MCLGTLVTWPLVVGVLYTESARASSRCDVDISRARVVYEPGPAGMYILPLLAREALGSGARPGAE